MSISVADPFLLSTYTSSKRTTYSEGSSGPSKYTNVYATQEHASTSEATSNFVTVGVQGEGVHIIDTSTLHPAISHTLGPSVAFSCPPVTEATQQDGVRLCTTYAVIEASQDITSEERGRAVWMWNESPTGDLTSSAETLRKKHTTVLSHRVSRIFVSPELPRHVLFIGTRGELTITDTDLKGKGSYTPSELHEESSALSFVFPRRTSTFTPTKIAPKQGVLVVNLSYEGNKGQIDVLAVDGNASIVPLGSLVLPALKSDIIDVTCSETGWISVMTRSGEWSAYQLDTPDYASLALSSRATIPLKNFSFISSLPAPSASPYVHEFSVLSLGSSHVLLAGVVASTSKTIPELVLLIWDLQYSVLLASHLFALPSSVVRTKRSGITLHVEGPSMHVSQVLLTLTSTSQLAPVGGDPGAHSQDDGGRRSSVLVVPITVPQMSTIAAAVGRASAGERWVLKASRMPTDGLVSQAEVKLVKAIWSAIAQKKVETAEDAFFAWAKEEEAKVFHKKKNAQGRSVKFGHEIVKRVLEAAMLSPREKDNADLMLQYSPKIVRYLLERGAVSSGMVSGGLLPALRLRKDWDSILLAMKTVRDIPEADIVSFLHFSLSQHLQSQTNDDAMQLDNGTAVPSPLVVLSLCVPYTVSQAALRLAIRQHFRDAEQLMYILQVLSGWLGTWTAHDISLLPAQTKKDAHGAIVPVYVETQLDVPPVDKVLTFLQALLDSSFLTFLSHPPSYALLRDVLSHIEPELGFMDDVDQLRGVLQPFVKAQAKAVHESAHGLPKPDQSVDWRRRRKEVHDQAAIAVGVYQIEELVL